jgi:hypothetical protein
MTDGAPRRQLRLGVPQPQVVGWLLVELWVLNIADLLLTRRAMWLGFATESNAVMGHFFRAGTLPTVLFKVGIVTVGSLLLWRLRQRREALLAAGALTAFFAAVVAYETLWLASL